jgi:hypothetical protein
MAPYLQQEIRRLQEIGRQRLEEEAMRITSFPAKSAS